MIVPSQRCRFEIRYNALGKGPGARLAIDSNSICSQNNTVCEKILPKSRDFHAEAAVCTHKAKKARFFNLPNMVATFPEQNKSRK